MLAGATVAHAGAWVQPKGKGQVIMSYEESYGYMLGDYVRDKDAVTASLILTEMAAWYAVQGMTLFDALNALYEKYGFRQSAKSVGMFYRVPVPAEG